jgi:hydrogenase nickel incorporation protein HypA/HybF
LHEFSTAQKILEVVLSEAGKNGARKVTAIELIIGEFNNIVPEALLFSLEVLSENTMAAGARVDLERKPVTVRCRCCRKEDRLESPHLFACPACGAGDVEITGGRELAVASLDVES